MLGDVQVNCQSRWFAFLISLFLLTAVASAGIQANHHHVRPGGIAAFTINVSNTGETPLNPVKVIDTLPKGMSYITDDNKPKGVPESNKIIWPNVGPLDLNESKFIHVFTKVDKNAAGRLTNNVTVIGTPVPDGYDVVSSDEENVDVLPPKECCNRVSHNYESITLGNQNAHAFGGGIATNNIRIITS